MTPWIQRVIELAAKPLLAGVVLLAACERTPAGQLTPGQQPVSTAAGQSIAITNVTVVDVISGAKATLGGPAPVSITLAPRSVAVYVPSR